MLLFNHHISFKPIDPLGDGLREEIIAEQQGSEALIDLEEGLDEEQLSDYWRAVGQDVENDPEWFHISED